MIFCGELALDGRVKPIAGCLPMAIQARDSGYSDFILPAENAWEAAVLRCGLRSAPQVISPRWSNI